VHFSLDIYLRVHNIWHNVSVSRQGVTRECLLVAFAVQRDAVIPERVRFDSCHVGVTFNLLQDILYGYTDSIISIDSVELSVG